MFTLAKDRCADFGTCTEAGTAPPNNVVIGLYQGTQARFRSYDCVAGEEARYEIAASMTVPLIQSLILYAHHADPKSAYTQSTTDRAHERAAAWSFARTVLPQIHHCVPLAAKVIRENLELGAKEPMRDGYLEIKRAVESAYPCMNITCKSVGGLLGPDGKTYIVGPCEDASLGSYTPGSGSGTVGLVVGVTFGVIVALSLGFCAGKRCGFGRSRAGGAATGPGGRGGGEYGGHHGSGMGVDEDFGQSITAV